MAATRLIKLHINKGKSSIQSLKARIDYVCNPGKTDAGSFICAYQCDAKTAAEEFALSHRQYHHQTGKSNQNEVLAYQIRQSFRPGEITPEKANQVGYELAKRFTKGKHAFVVATHTDRAHIHNHIIFNAVTLDGSRKFKDFYLSGIALQRVSDLLCLEHGLSVIEPKPYNQRNQAPVRQNRKSMRQELRQAIDRALASKPKDFDALVQILQSQGYEYKGGTHPAFRQCGKRQFMRLSSLGCGYSESDLRVAISKPSDRKMRMEETSGKQSASLLIDIERKLQEGRGPGYERWAKLFNLKQASQTLCFLQEQGIDDYEVLMDEKQNLSKKISELSQQIQAREKRLNEVIALKKHIIQYRRTKEIYMEYRKSNYNSMFYDDHREDIVKHQAAKATFEQLKGAIPTIKALNMEYAALVGEKKELYRMYRETKKTWKSLVIAKQNVDMLLEMNGGRPTMRNGKESANLDR